MLQKSNYLLDFASFVLVSFFAVNDVFYLEVGILVAFYLDIKNVTHLGSLNIYEDIMQFSSKQVYN